LKQAVPGENLHSPAEDGVPLLEATVCVLVPSGIATDHDVADWSLDPGQITPRQLATSIQPREPVKYLLLGVNQCAAGRTTLVEHRVGARLKLDKVHEAGGPNKCEVHLVISAESELRH
jgi:hypothetical protein